MGGSTQLEARIECVRRGFDAFADSDFDVLRELCHPWLDFRDELGPLRGVEAVRTYMQDWFSHLDGFRAELGSVIEMGEALVADVRQIAHPQGSDRAIEEHFTHVFAWYEDSIATWHIYADRDKALVVASSLTPMTPRPR